MQQFRDARKGPLALIFAGALVSSLSAAAAPAAAQEDLTACRQGVEAREAGDAELAVASFSRCLEQGGLQFEAVIKTLINRGFAFFDLGRPDEAIEDFSTVINLAPDYPLAHNLRGVAYFQTGRYELAIADFDAALERDPSYLPAYNNRGNAYLLTRQLDKAIADFDAAIARDPRYADAYNNRGNAHRARGAYGEALADYEAALEIDPDFGQARRNRGLARFLDEDFDGAVADFEAVLPDEAENPHAFYTAFWRHIAARRAGHEDAGSELAAWLEGRERKDWPAPLGRYLIGEIGEAALLEAATAEDPARQAERRVEAYFYIGEIALAAGDEGKARQSFDAALETGAESFVEYLAARAERARL